MTDLTSTLQIILKDAGYQSWLISVDRRTIISFEDEALIGFAFTFETPQSLISQWQDQETAVLARFNQQFREAQDKAWNIYSLFLCASSADEAQAREIREIEENLERTRKIAACDLTSHEETAFAILPILPIQYRPRLEEEHYVDRLRKRIADFAPLAADAALNETIPAAEVAHILGARR